MPQLRQLVIGAEDPGRLAEFYEAVFELERIDQSQNAVVLSDGVFNLALIAGGDRDRLGFNAVGFDTVRVESLRKKLSPGDLPAADLREVGNSPAGAEYELTDPDGNRGGFAEERSTWLASSGRCRFGMSRSIRRGHSDSRIFTAEFSI